MVRVDDANNNGGMRIVINDFHFQMDFYLLIEWVNESISYIYINIWFIYFASCHVYSGINTLSVCEQGKMRLKVNNEIVIDYHLKFMKMENHLNFNFPFVIIKLNHSLSRCRNCDKQTTDVVCSSNGSSYLSLLFLIQFYHSARKWNPTTLIFVHTRKFTIQLCGKNKITTASTALTTTTTTTTTTTKNWNMVEFDEWTNNQHERFVYKQTGRKKRNAQKLRTLAQKYLTRVERQ